MTKDPKQYAKLYKTEQIKKRAPKDVDPEKHERCVHEVKQQGHSVGSAHAICTASMKKDFSTENVGCGEGLSGKICRHNTAKLNKASELEIGTKIEAEHKDTIKQIIEDVKAGKVKSFKEYFKDIAEDHIAELKDYYTRLTRMEDEAKKSYDYPDIKVRIDSNDQQAAELTANSDLVRELKGIFQSIDLGESREYFIPFGKVILFKKAEGLYSGHVIRHEDGETVEKFDDQTLEMIAKNLELKNLVDKAFLNTLVPVPITPIVQEVPKTEMEYVAEEEADEAVEEHNKEYHSGPSYLRIKAGDFEIELKKSVRNFVSNYKKNQIYDKNTLRKALCIWKEKVHVHLPNNAAAAKELLDNWNLHKESFNQILFALEQMKKDHE